MVIAVDNNALLVLIADFECSAFAMILSWKKSIVHECLLPTYNLTTYYLCCCRSVIEIFIPIQKTRGPGLSFLDTVGFQILFTMGP